MAVLDISGSVDCDKQQICWSKHRPNAFIAWCPNS
jgi:hypothetical protein